MKKAKTVWEMTLLYKSINDPKIEDDMKVVENSISKFANKYDTSPVLFIKTKETVLEALKDYDALLDILGSSKISTYFLSLSDVNLNDNKVRAKKSQMLERLNDYDRKLIFFKDSLSKIEQNLQKEILKDSNFASYHYFLKRIFENKHRLSPAEENIMSLKKLPAHGMWVDMAKKAYSTVTLKWRGKIYDTNQAQHILATMTDLKQREKLALEIYNALEKAGDFAEAELNAIVTNKKINDKLRNFAKPYDATVLDYENESKTIENLVKAVAGAYKISHKFYKLKAKLLGQSKLNYWDRGIDVGKINKKFDFHYSVDKLGEIFATIDPRFSKLLKDYVANGQIDVYPRKGKQGGAYCRSGHIEPTYILLNHNDRYYAFCTLAHEMGHAIHTYLSRSQKHLYSGYSMALAETASTFFENYSRDCIEKEFSPKEKLIALHDRLAGNIATIMRQIACFKFELDLHNTIREKGYLSKVEIGELHNKNMSAYTGPSIKFPKQTRYGFVNWLHIRRFFYVYSYAFGLLVSKALLRRYKEDKNYWSKIEQLFSSGCKDSPENLLAEIDLDIPGDQVWKEGLKSLEEEVDTFEKLVNEELRSRKANKKVKGKR
jgi:oligoendopeptidase F